MQVNILCFMYVGWMEQLCRSGDVHLWCLIRLFFPNLSVVTIQWEHFTLVKWWLVVLAIFLCYMCYSMQCYILCFMQVGQIEQLSRPGQVRLWCHICPFLSKFVCSNNTIGTFYSCGMVSSCFNHTFMLDVLIHIVSIFYVLCMLDGWSN